MNIKKDLNLKWIDSKHFHQLPSTQKLINSCLLLVKKKQDNSIIGFTVFEPRDLTANIFDRLSKRIQKDPSTDLTTQLFIPPSFQQRAKTVIPETLEKHISITLTPFIKMTQSAGLLVVHHRMKVINVDDSPVLLKFLKHNLDEMGFIDIISQISDSTKAVESILRHKPDVVTMDIQMPKKTGVQVVKEVLAQVNMPIIMISSLNLEEGSMVLDALNSGAFDYLQKPKLEDRKDFQSELLEKLLLATDSNTQIRKSTITNVKKTKTTHQMSRSLSPNSLWCLGASTGGTQALSQVLTSLPNQIPPTLIVQHIPPVFSKAFADSVNQLCPFPITEAIDGEILEPNHVYIAPGGFQMALKQDKMQIRISIRDDAPVNRFKPSVDYLFYEVEKLKGFRVVAGVLTGIGKDGAKGLLALKKAGAKTFVQDEKTCTVYGMPRAAFEIGATDMQIPLDRIANTLIDLSEAVLKAA